MKKLLFIACLLFLGISFNAKSQSSPLGPDKFSQMWNMSNTYFGTVKSTTEGNQLDTVTTGTTKYLTTSNWNSYNYDSARLTGLPGAGYLSFTISCLKGSSSADSILITPQQSFDGITWVTIPNSNLMTGTSSIAVTDSIGTSTAAITTSTYAITTKLVPTSTTVPVVASWNFVDCYALYYRLQCVATNAASVKGYFYFKPKLR